MASKSLKARLQLIEDALGGRQMDPIPPIFVKVEDASVPDPDAPPSPNDLGDAAIIGFRGHLAGVSTVTTRQPGESLAALKARAAATCRETVLFFAVYRDEVMH